eukprot:9240225-Lingulodinium_polyedra.AAC.1
MERLPHETFVHLRRLVAGRQVRVVHEITEEEAILGDHDYELLFSENGAAYIADNTSGNVQWVTELLKHREAGTIEENEQQRIFIQER